MKLEHPLIGVVMRVSFKMLPVKTLFFVRYPAISVLGVMKRQTAAKSALNLSRVKVGVPYTDFGNDLFNTFYLWLYGVGHMVEDHSDSERGNLLPPHGLLFLINSKGSFICTIP